MLVKVVNLKEMTKTGLLYMRISLLLESYYIQIIVMEVGL